MSSGYGSPAPSARPVRSSTRKQKVAPGTPTPTAAPSTNTAVTTPQTTNYFPQQYYGANQAGFSGTPGSYQPATGGASAPVAALNLSSAGPTSAVPPIPTFHQARVSTYASRMRTGATLLMQPILSASGTGTTASLSVALTTTGRTGRARAAVNYADAASGDEFEDDSDDEDFSQNKKEAAAKRAAKAAAGAAGSLAGGPGAGGSTELDQSYLGKKPPEKFISSRVAQPAKHQYYLRDAMEKAAERSELLVPIRVEVDTETHRIRDCFTWNLNEDLITPQAFATTFCNDLDLPLSHVDNIVTMIRAQLDEHSGVVTMDVGPGDDENAEEPDCRVILRLDVQLDNYHLVDHIEWDLCSSPATPETTPEAFAKQLCRDLGLRGESVAIIAHALHEEIIKHKKDAIEWGILGGGGGAVPEDGGYRRNQRGPRRLRGVWRDWMEFKDYGPRMEILTPEELEKKEMERERASRRMRRETSKFQRNTGGGSYRDNRPPRPSRLR
ncbi:Chromatin structure remodeling complex protein sfh1 [Tulasnella sp. 417]|nr:Chromatin structure remodeling complex protein sfh1 [Tulasnella sp. 417]